jgi:hypothetical protein
MVLAAEGEWILSVKAYDVRRIESPLALPVAVTVVEPTARVFLPHIGHGEP